MHNRFVVVIRKWWREREKWTGIASRNSGIVVCMYVPQSDTITVANLLYTRSWSYGIPTEYTHSLVLGFVPD